MNHTFKPNKFKNIIGVVALNSSVLLLSACGGSAEKYSLDLIADVNRDGYIDKKDSEAAETVSAGVIVLPNLDDDGMRCKALMTRSGENNDGAVKETEEFVTCNDAADSVSNGADDIADLTKVNLVVSGKYDDNATFSLKLLKSDGTPDESKKFRVLAERGTQYVDILEQPLTLDDVTKGIQLAVEATDILRSSEEWDGKTTLSVSIQHGENTYSDDIPFVVAPVITQHDISQAEQLFIAASNVAEKDDEALEGFKQSPPTATSLEKAFVNRRFIDDMTNATVNDVNTLTVLSDTQNDIWIQDMFEPGFVSRPDGAGAHMMRILLRSANTGGGAEVDFSLLPQFAGKTKEEIDEYLGNIEPDEYFKLYDRAMALSGASTLRNGAVALYSELRGKNVGVVQIESSFVGNQEGADTYNSTGNFTTVPPLSGDANNQLGRMVYGSTPNPRFLDLLKAQQKQSPVWVDTSWLFVGHVDEFFTILPSTSTKRGWVLGIADPKLAYEVLKQASESSTDKLSLLKGVYALANAEDGDDSDIPDDGTGGDEETSTLTVVNKEVDLDTMLADESLQKVNDFAVNKIEEALALLKTAFNLEEQDIVRLPVLYKKAADADRDGPNSGDGSDEELDYSAISVGSYIPNAVNGVYTGNYTFVSPKQFGPMVNGVDVLQQKMENNLKEHGVTVTWVDDYLYAHVGEGEIHCVTNTYRKLDDVLQWWNK